MTFLRPWLVWLECLQLQVLHDLGRFARRREVSDGSPLKGMGKMNSEGGGVVGEGGMDPDSDSDVLAGVEIMLISEDAPERE